MSRIVLHHVPASRSFRVLWMLEELGLEAEIVPHTITGGSLRAPEVLAVTPAGRVPALEIDGQGLFESGAILEYLAERHPEAGLGRGPGSGERVAWLQGLHFAETMASLIENLNLNHVFLRPPARPSPAVVKILTARLRDTLRALEGRLREDGYLLVGGFSAADVMLGFNLWAAPRFVRMDPFPKIEAYKARLAARPAFAAARAKDGEQAFYDREFYEVPDA
ncbi:glutathione S-transferase family protein [Jannaschia formosa]|uniref:glutathione S-transferase family protein n=1 Tax=Jannaschia formosa TaxID=2259592 RepID=UPI000E1B9F95|nr:glutathione S-transferase [Jannaschia formosa]TFL20241.1 glutathione S-transferase [Jannaschia formosa]